MDRLDSLTAHGKHEYSRIGEPVLGRRRDELDLAGVVGAFPAGAGGPGIALTANGDFEPYWHYHLRREHERIHSARCRESLILAA